MNEFALYLLKSACWLTGFAVVYFLFLKNERFFILKRMFLLCGILASVILPLISFHYRVEIQSLSPLSADQEPGILNAIPGILQQIPAENKVGINNYLLIVYSIGLSLFALRLFYHILLKIKIINRHRIYDSGSSNIIRSSDYPSSFSFFNYIFINPSIDKKEYREILNHELVHVKQKHWLDLLLAEILSLLQWANPIVWIYTGFIRLNHEYIADEVALQRSTDPNFYKAALLNHIFRSPVISLSNSFNYSIHKSRFEMMKNMISSPYRKLKVLFIIPVFPVLFYAFSQPEFTYSENNPGGTLNLNKKEVKGVVTKQDGAPFPGVQIAITGTNIREATDASGKFSVAEVPEESHIIFSYRGYLTQVLKPQFSGPMSIKLLVDPAYVGTRVSSSYKDALVVIDEVISDKLSSDALKDIDPSNIARMTILSEKEGTAKYGDKGKKGVIEIITQKKAAELGLKVPLRRSNPEDFPTFQGESHLKFSSWLAERIKYPADAVAKGITGRVTVNITIQPDGSVASPTITSAPDKSMGDAVVKIINESPRWEPAKNPEAREPFSSSVSLKFGLPNNISPDNTFIVVEQMPEYPGGSAALLEFISHNTKYPEAAKAEKAEGRVIVRFVINSKGQTEDPVVLKGIHPLLDAEALRVVNLLTGWLPGAQGGKPVDVWYMVPVTFALSGELRTFTLGQ